MNENILMYCEMWQEESITAILDIAIERGNIEKELADEYFKQYFELIENDEDTQELELSVLNHLGVSEWVFEEFLENQNQ